MNTKSVEKNHRESYKYTFQLPRILEGVFTMLRTSLVGLALLCLVQSCAASPAFTPQNITPEDETLTRLATACPLTISPVNFMNTVEAVKKSYKCLDGKELTAVKVDKGTTFKVRSLEAMDSDTPLGTIINFKSQIPEALIPDEEPSEVMFSGEVVENNPPRLAGRSATIKLAIRQIKVNNITYPAAAYISKMGEKRAMGGALAGLPIYADNLANLANQGTITIDRVYKNPCEYDDCITSTVVKPFYYLGGALLQLADLMVAPVICLFKSGTKISIPAETAFEIKLDENVSLLKL